METANLTSHNIHGYVPDGRKISVPIFSQIEDNLWMGGCPVSGIRLDQYFDVILNLYCCEPYRVDREKVLYREAPLDDWREIPPLDTIVGLAEWVSDRLNEGKRVLVHCQAGLNRSGLITAFTLMMRGRSAEEAIKLLRQKRCELVLCNQEFEKFLMGIA